MIGSLALIVALAPTNIPTVLGRHAETYARQQTFSGVILAAQNGKIVFHRAYGWAYLEGKLKNRTDTKFNIASITKPMTTAILVQLLVEKKVGIGDKLSKYIPDFPRGDAISILDLLNHRAGIPPRVTTAEDEARPQTAATMVEFAKKAPLLFEPGSKSVYSSAGFSVLARVIEIAEGKPYGQVIRERIFRPCGMSTAENCDPFTVIKNRAGSYAWLPSGMTPSPAPDLSFLVGAGSVFATADDLYKFAAGVQSGKLGESVKQNLLRPPHTYWNGLTSGYHATVDIDDKYHTVLVILANEITGATDELREAFAKASAGETAPEPTTVSLPKYDPGDAALRELEGNYVVHGTDTRFDCWSRSGILMAGNTGLIPVAPDRFFSVRDFGSVRVKRDDSRRIVGLDWAPSVGSPWVVDREPSPDK